MHAIVQRTPPSRSIARVTVPGDVHEREADRLASRALEAGAARRDRSCPCGGGCPGCRKAQVSGARGHRASLPARADGLIEAGLPPLVGDVVRSSGEPLDPAAREDLAPGFGWDFRNVRVHRDALAAESAKSVGARAYAVGSHIVFARGSYQPTSPAGRALIAHELAHVIAPAGERGGVPVLQRDRDPQASNDLPSLFTMFVADPRKSRDWRYARRIGREDAARIRKVGSLSLEDRHEVNAKLRFFEGPAKDAYIRQVKPVLERVVPEAIEMPEEYVGTVDTPLDVLEAIVNIMSATDYFGDLTAQGEMHPLHYIQFRKSILKKEYVDLLWWWFQITHEKITDRRGVQTIVQGAMARVHIPEAVAQTAPIVKAVAASGGRQNATLIARYRKKVDEFSQRAVREEVGEMLDTGMKAEEKSRPDFIAKNLDEQTRIGAVKASATLTQVAGVARRITGKDSTGTVKPQFDKKLSEWVKTFLREERFIPEPVAPSMKMNVADGITWLKGGLDGVTAVLTVADPEARRKLFEARSSFFGEASRRASINQVLWQFVSGSIAVSGASVYGIARIVGNTTLAGNVLELSIRWVGNISGPLFLAGIFHGAAVLLDPDATTDEKVEAGVEVASGASGFAGWAARWTPRLAGAAKWSGPIAGSLFINFHQFKYLANIANRGRIGFARLDWAPCHRATKAAALEAQQWATRLAVVNALMAQESDHARLREMRKLGEAFREELIERQIKPFVVSKTSHGGTDQEHDGCGSALTDRFKPLVPLLDGSMKSDDAALQLAASFLSTIHTAFVEWDRIVDSRSH